MIRLPRRVRMAVLLRSYAVQGSWNYETLIGTGFAFALLPALRVLYRGDDEGLREALARHTTLFNSHPYLATVAVGAVARLEADRTDPRIIERFKRAMRGSLGALGDQLVWCSWRPASSLLGMLVLLAGGAWWAGVGLFLLVYNALHVVLRAWGLRVGLDAGLQVGSVLREAPLQSLTKRAADAGAALCGFAVVLPFLSLGSSPAQIAPAALAIPVGLWLGLGGRRVWALVVVAAWSVAMLSSWIL